MTAAAVPEKPAPVRVSTLLTLLVNRTRSPAEAEAHMRLQATAEFALQALAVALGDLDEQPLRMLLMSRYGSQDEA